MSMGTLTMLAESVHGVLIGADRPFEAVSTDTRSLSEGDLFFALRGERFDASQFIDEAARRGAAGAVVEHRQSSELPQVEVTDSRRALGDFARSWRAGFQLPVIGVTGSNGKTTVKELIAAILRADTSRPEDVLATTG
ncbi:MAG TPA: UDP-N-acetylmuramoyl-tripeptide--D-alanyl-D-alanine ligase, partial [Chromatiales bacterium]|nr:UDP-N-acetylmuramoyl-tripeptide--D-alanyl-D-alanine ligase [Chromatiales bacterium]